jgi:SWI/SNF-related matrix-associated actin-dependent regulator 1 of chromatin subfamily A
MPIPLPTQLSGAKFLASRRAALLADAPRVGKTGAAIIAADLVMADTILVVTTASGRAVWKRGFADWSAFNRPLQVLEGSRKLDPKTAIAVAGWGGLSSPKIRSELLRRPWDLVILDESHAAKNFDAKRTAAVYGVPFDDGRILHHGPAITNRAGAVWCLTGTPIPNAPNDLYPMMQRSARSGSRR